MKFIFLILTILICGDAFADKGVIPLEVKLNGFAGLCDPFVNYVVNVNLNNDSCELQETVNKHKQAFKYPTKNVPGLILERESRIYSCDGKKVIVDVSWRHRVWTPRLNSGTWEHPCRIDSINIK